MKHGRLGMVFPNNPNRFSRVHVGKTAWSIKGTPGPFKVNLTFLVKQMLTVASCFFYL